MPGKRKEQRGRVVLLLLFLGLAVLKGHLKEMGQACKEAELERKQACSVAKT